MCRKYQVTNVLSRPTIICCFMSAAAPLQEAAMPCSPLLLRQRLAAAAVAPLQLLLLPVCLVSAVVIPCTQLAAARPLAGVAAAACSCSQHALDGWRCLISSSEKLPGGTNICRHRTTVSQTLHATGASKG